MDNKFIVLTCRFHTKKENKLYIAGYFEENNIGENKISFYLDTRELYCKIEEKKRLVGGAKTRIGDIITKEYFMWLELPRDWKTMKRFQIVNTCQKDEQLAFDIPVSELKRLEQVYPKNIDMSIVDKEGFKVTGWYIDREDVKIHFIDKSQNDLKVKLKSVERPDVKTVYPECSEGEIKGFEAVYNGKTPKKVMVVFETNDKQIETLVRLKVPMIERIFRK